MRKISMLAALLLAGIGAYAAEGAKIFDSNFESSKDGWYLGGTVTLNDGEGVNGSKGVCFERVKGGKSPWFYKRVQLVPGKTYKFSFDYKLNIEKPLPSLEIYYIQHLKADKKTGIGSEQCRIKGARSEQDWKRQEVVFTMPADAVSSRFYLTLNRGVQGKVWFDNVCLEEVAAAK